MTFEDAFIEVLEGYTSQFPDSGIVKEEMAALIQAAATICASRDMTERLMGLLKRKIELPTMINIDESEG